MSRTSFLLPKPKTQYTPIIYSASDICHQGQKLWLQYCVSEQLDMAEEIPHDRSTLTAYTKIPNTTRREKNTLFFQNGRMRMTFVRTVIDSPRGIWGWVNSSRFAIRFIDHRAVCKHTVRYSIPSMVLTKFLWAFKLVNFSCQYALDRLGLVHEWGLKDGHTQPFQQWDTAHIDPFGGGGVGGGGAEGAAM